MFQVSTHLIHKNTLRYFSFQFDLHFSNLLQSTFFLLFMYKQYVQTIGNNRRDIIHAFKSLQIKSVLK